ncbi:MAG: hypothetical protein HY646_14440 [Acidobacteria bacterium]|nr:hypothetical protein [Acidobacteriota bacterium]
MKTITALFGWILVFLISATPALAQNAADNRVKGAPGTPSSPELTVIAKPSQFDIPDHKFANGRISLLAVAVGQPIQPPAAPFTVSMTVYRPGSGDRIVFQVTHVRIGDSVTPVQGRIFTATVAERNGRRRYLPIEGGAELRLKHARDLAGDVEIRLGLELTPDIARALAPALPRIQVTAAGAALSYLSPPSAKAIAWIDLAEKAPVQVVQQAESALAEKDLALPDRLAISVALGDALLRLDRTVEAQRAYEDAAKILSIHIVPDEIRADVADRMFQSQLRLNPVGALANDDVNQDPSPFRGWLKRYLRAQSAFITKENYR